MRRTTRVFTWQLPFWEQPALRWTGMMDAGLMVKRRRGLIVNIGYWAARKFLGNVIYGVAKAATDKMTADLAHELRPYGVSVISLYPGLVRTEAVLEAAKASECRVTRPQQSMALGSHR